VALPAKCGWRFKLKCRIYLRVDISGTLLLIISHMLSRRPTLFIYMKMVGFFGLMA